MTEFSEIMKIYGYKQFQFKKKTQTNNNSSIIKRYYFKASSKSAGIILLYSVLIFIRVVCKTWL